MWPLAVMFGAQAISNIWAASEQREAQERANATNLSIARQQNALNYRMFQEQNQINLDRWHMNNEYNSPLAQRSRLEEAGINPALALGNVSTGNATASTSATPAPAVGATVVPEDGMAQGIQNGINSMVSTLAGAYMQNRELQIKDKLASSQAAGISLDNQGKIIDLSRRDARNLAEIREINSRANVNNANYDRAYQDFDNIMKKTPLELMALQSDINLKVSQADVQDTVKRLNLSQLKLNGQQERLLQAQTAHTVQSTMYLVQQGKLSATQAEKLVSDIVLSRVQALNIKANTKQIETMLKPMLEELKSRVKVNNANARKTEAEADITEIKKAYEHVNQWVNIGTNIVNTTANAVGAFMP